MSFHNKLFETIKDGHSMMWDIPGSYMKFDLVHMVHLETLAVLPELTSIGTKYEQKGR